jgi:hypothetical protein
VELHLLITYLLLFDFTYPENKGVWGCGGVVFSRTQKMWASAIFTFPENVGECYFINKKSVKKMWACAIFTYPEKMG